MIGGKTGTCNTPDLNLVGTILLVCSVLARTQDLRKIQAKFNFILLASIFLLENGYLVSFPDASATTVLALTYSWMLYALLMFVVTSLDSSHAIHVCLFALCQSNSALCQSNITIRHFLIPILDYLGYADMGHDSWKSPLAFGGALKKLVSLMRNSFQDH